MKIHPVATLARHKKPMPKAVFWAMMATAALFPLAALISLYILVARPQATLAAPEKKVSGWVKKVVTKVALTDPEAREALEKKP